MFGDNAAAAMQFPCVKASIGRRYQSLLPKSFFYSIGKERPVMIYVQWVRGNYNPVDPFRRPWSDLDEERELAMVAARERCDTLWERSHLRTVFLWTLWVPMGPFAMP